MKILAPIASSKVPARSAKWRRNSDYDAIISRAAKLKASKVLPIECEDLTKAKSTYAALRSRQKREGELDGFNIYRIDNTVYLERAE